MVKAKELGAARVTRPQLLAELFNSAESGIAVGGTSGKSTVTGMIGWILHAIGRDPTVMNGAVMKNFVSADAPFASALVGAGGAFVSEVDESDGSIALYRPKVAVLNNITLDHKSLDELRHLFRDFAGKAETVVLNLDDDETRFLAATLPPERLRGYSFADRDAHLFGSDLAEEPFAVAFKANGVPVRLQVPGRHNAENALAALAAAEAVGIPLEEAASALAGFEGLRRRFERVGEANGISVIDDFAHNPDKIAATLRTLHAFSGRLLLFFQPHGYGPLRTMKDELIATFAEVMEAGDRLIMPDPVYYGGTVERTVGSGDIVAGVRKLGGDAEHIRRASGLRRPARGARPPRGQDRGDGRPRRQFDLVRRGDSGEASRMTRCCSSPRPRAETPPAQIPNPDFDQGMQGWSGSGHSGFSALSCDRLQQRRPATHWLKAGWAARSGTPPRDAELPNRHLRRRPPLSRAANPRLGNDSRPKFAHRVLDVLVRPAPVRARAETRIDVERGLAPPFA